MCGCFTQYLSLQLSNDERLQLAKRVHDKAAGRAVIVASGTFEGTIQEKAEFVKKMGEIVEAVVVLVNQMCREGRHRSKSCSDP